MRPTLVFVGVLACGCDVVLGLEEPSQIELTVVRRALRNNAEGVPTLSIEPFPADGLDVRVQDPLGASIAVTRESDERFTFQTSGTYRVTLDSDRRSTEYQLDARTAHLAPLFSRPEATFASPSTELAIQINNLKTENRSGFYAIGPFFFTHGPTDTTMNPSFVLRFDTLLDNSPAPLLDAGAHDRAVVVHWGNYTSGAGPYSALDQFLEAAITMTDGQRTMLAGQATDALATVPRRTRLAIPGTSLTAKLRASWEQPETRSGLVWQLNAGFGDLGATRLAQLAFANDPSDEVYDVTYGNPFRHPDVLLVASAVILRDLVTNGNPLTLAARLTEVVRVVPGDPAPTTLSSSVGIPAAFHVDGTLLVDDDQPIRIARDRPVSITWEVDGPGDRHSVELFELPLTSPPILLRTIITPQPAILIDADVLVRGRTYVMLVGATSGYPDASRGDIDGFVLGEGAGTGLVYSRAFEIVN